MSISSLRQTQQLLMSVGRVKEPADLGLKLRLAISREAAGVAPFALRRHAHAPGKYRCAPFMVPATAGLACAVLIFGLVTAILAIPGEVQANNQDVPLVLEYRARTSTERLRTFSEFHEHRLAGD